MTSPTTKNLKNIFLYYFVIYFKYRFELARKTKLIMYESSLPWIVFTKYHRMLKPGRFLKATVLSKYFGKGQVKI